MNEERKREREMEGFEVSWALLVVRGVCGDEKMLLQPSFSLRKNKL